jgi:cobalamin biosynthesis Mg chelatase CobN
MRRRSCEGDVIMGKVKKIFSKPKTPSVDTAAIAAAEKAKAEAAATATANATLVEANRRKRAQSGLLSSEEGETVLSTGSQRAAANATANATVLGGGGR